MQKVFNGNNIDLLKDYPDNYFDAVVTDPPYGLGKEPNAAELMKDWIEHGYHEISGSGFMGKEWDAFVPQPIFWKEVFRVLKPGGHVLSFFGTRTYDWGVMSMRFAGFEVRDCIQWLYGSGFPKSHNISKALDKQGGESLDWFIEYILEVAKERGISKKELTMLFPSKNGNPTGWLWNKQNNQSITLEQYNTIKEYLSLPFESIEEAKGEVIGKGKAGLTKGDIANFSGETEFDITAPSTDAAKQWDGWGTALKPANEPIVLARKPLEKGLSIAENILKWGVGGINIDASRIGLSKGDDSRLGGNGSWKTDKAAENVYEGGYEGKDIASSPLGRFPANIILDEVAAEILDEQSGVSKSSKSARLYINDTEGRSVKNGASGFRDPNSTYGDKGGASRFFYVAKASKSERNKGLDDFEEKVVGTLNSNSSDLENYGGMSLGGASLKGEHKNPIPKANHHPTVKPIKLMQYLVKMITPPNGIVLDPFCGSGTTGVACKLDGFQFIGLEQDPEYTKIAEARINNYIDKEQSNTKEKDQLTLF